MKPFSSRFSVSSHPWLREIPNPPKQIFLRGAPNSLRKPCIAIVGTRRPSAYGIRAAIYFARELAVRGFTIVSGLARGIDSYAHRGALLAGGTTVAVLGHGLNRIYPPENQELSQEIVMSRGALISEYGENEPPLPHHFPERNRIISGLSLGTLIVEAAEKSGSLITARFALEQNRSVFVIPSRIEDKSFTGGNLLLQQGAKLVMKVEDLLEEFPGSYCEIKGNSLLETDQDFELKKLFQHHQNHVTLSDIYSRPKDQTEKLLKDLEAAILGKKALEVAPQHYIWIE